MSRPVILLTLALRSAAAEPPKPDFPPQVPVARADAAAPRTRLPNGVAARENPGAGWRVRVTLPAGAAQAERVNLAGDFNGWNRDRTPMQRQAEGGWAVEVPMEAGVRLYKFVLDGERWIEDPGNPDR
ncbi:MAG: hypothetical protein EBQ99_07370, partial [Planctomycetes bacterium]|nr:hypothetical protein [Planctomycetota bacterium]